MRTTVRLAGALAAFVLTSATLSAQFSLTTLFASNNGGSTGGIVYYDITVTNAVRITAFDTNFSIGAGTAVGLNVYTVAGTYVGNETNPGAWTQVATGSGTAAGRDLPTNIPLAAPLILTPGSYGMALVAVGSGHAYTNGNGTNQNYSDANIALALGEAQNVPFTGTPFNPRVWNGTIYYSLGDGLFANFDATPTSGASPLAVNFTDTTFTSDPGGVTSWAWDLDGDGTIDSTTQNPSFTYTTCGRYDVTLTATDATHPPSTITKPAFITVDPQLLVSADFTATPTQGAVPLSVSFTDTSSGSPTSWAWDFDGDGTVDSTVQNPSFTYAAAGLYDVTLTASNACGGDTETKTGFINVIGATGNTRSADILEYQFNEVRGATAANVASTNLAPPHGLVNTATWQADPGRPGYSGNEAGFGCLGYGSNANVDSGWPVSVSGDITIMFWMRRDPASTTTNPFGYAFGDGTFRAFAAGAAGTGLLFRGSTAGITDMQLQANIVNNNNWQHIAIVVDDANGVGTMYYNGALDSTINFAPGAFGYSGTNNMTVAANNGSSSWTTHYDMDDFRFYGRALTASEVASAASAENPTAGSFDDGCAGPSGIAPAIGADSAPAIGNLGFSVTFDNAEVGRGALLMLGVNVHLGGILPAPVPFFGPSCSLGVLPDTTIGMNTGAGSGSVNIPIPNNPFFAGVHGYAQMVIMGTSGAFTPVLDVNIQQ